MTDNELSFEMYKAYVTDSMDAALEVVKREYTRRIENIGDVSSGLPEYDQGWHDALNSAKKTLKLRKARLVL
jgi:hypothetical protein